MPRKNASSRRVEERVYIYARLVNLAIEREQEEKEEQTRSDRMDLSYIYDIYIYIRTVPSKWVNA